MSRFAFTKFDAVGFDMDGVLAKYDFYNFFNIIYELSVKYLVTKKGYEKKIFPDFNDVKGFCSKGVVLDGVKGNVFKCGTGGKIYRASHGTKFLSGTDVYKQYEKGKWDQYKIMMNTVGKIKDDYAYVDSLYEIPVIYLFARLVDHIDQNISTENGNPNNHLTYQSALEEAYEALRNNYMPAPVWPTDDLVNFAEHGRDNPHLFMKQQSSKVRDWLQSLRKQGMTTFVLTSSGVDFTKSVLSHTLGPEYDSLFDLYMCNAWKPLFFKSDKPFVKCDKDAGTPIPNHVVTDFEKGAWYSRGSLQHFNHLFHKFAGKDDAKIAFVGDGLKNDTFPASSCAKWATVHILENMVAEGMQNWPCHSEDSSAQAISQRDIGCLTSEEWGSYFCEDSSNTMSSDILHEHASIAVPHLDYLVDLPLDYQFSTFKSKESGYFPAKPVNIRHEES